MISEPTREMTRARLPGLVCLSVLFGILVAGLWPFHAPRNAVTWLENQNGLRFGRYGTIVSSGAFQMAGSVDEASSSLEIWLQPGLLNTSNTILSFSTPENLLQFSLNQYFSSLILQREVRGRQNRIGIDGVFRQIKPLFITITSSAQQTAIYVDGALASIFPHFRLDQDLTGQLVIGPSPVTSDGWRGQLLGLAIYHRELTAAEVVKHYDTWTKQGRPELSGNERVIALYLFSEHSGIVHNAVQPGIDLQIPERFSLLHQPFLEPFWKEYKPGWEHWVDSILINIVGFIPLGFFFCAYWSYRRPMKRPAVVTTVLGLAISFTIEVLQSYLPTRTSGTTDLMTNTLGTFLGVMLYCSKTTRAFLGKIYGFSFLRKMGDG
jgi:VanZ family protein